MRTFIKSIFATTVLLGSSHLIGCRTAQAEPQPTFVAAHLTDIHLREQFNSVPRFRAFVSQMRKENPDVSIVLNTGDILDGHKGRWEYWTGSVEAELSDLPIYNLLGNHDAEADISDTKALCKVLNMPGRYYAFDHKGWRFFMLDGNTLAGDQEQVEWLAGELKKTPSSMPAVILSHQSIERNIGITSMLSSYPNVQLCLSGHTHLHERSTVNGITYISGGAVSGYWWETEASTDGKGGYKGTPPGFGLVRFHGDGSFSYTYIEHDH